MPASPHAYHESDRFSFYMLRVGATIVRKRDNASVYFQPGDDTALALSDVDSCAKAQEAWRGENEEIFNRWCAQYF